MAKRPTVLMILDGYGLNDRTEGNAVALAKTPVMDRLMKEYPFVKAMLVVWQLDFQTDRWEIQRLDILIWVLVELFIRSLLVLQRK